MADDFDEQYADYASNGFAEKPAAEPVEIPMDAVSEDALEGLIEAFVLREGTDYGTSEITLETKKRQIREQLKRNEVRIVFDPDSESVTLMNARDWMKISRLQS